ncbi:Ig-like domain-containing protein [Brevibacillus dissolubilis]|uniref:Ig-like domain-containing protein n=1 Tax=Brevibacillus dissolubilis TaxID=1844116 RepID=UPI001116BC59|nr:Ig-like domain-containing protein [Brevibacillus dissolubilis]
MKSDKKQPQSKRFIATLASASLLFTLGSPVSASMNGNQTAALITEQASAKEALITKVTASNGYISVRLSSKQETAPKPEDFTFHQIVSGKKSEGIEVTGFVWDQAKREARFTYEPLKAEKEQKVRIRASYGGAVKSSVYFTLAAEGAKAEKVTIINTAPDAKLTVGSASDESLRLLAFVTDQSRKQIADATVTWRSTDTDVATVDDTGRVTAVGEGNTAIIAAVDGMEASIPITVSETKQPTITLESSVLYESSADNGSVQDPVVLRLSDGKWANELQAQWFNTENLPAGLEAQVERISDEIVMVRFTGRASKHDTSDSVSNVMIQIDPKAVEGAEAGLRTKPFTILFMPPVTVPDQPDLPPVITGVEHLKVYRDTVTPVSLDTDIARVELVRITNGIEPIPFTFGQPITEEGNYAIYAVDRAGNGTLIEFTILRSPLLTGVTNDREYTESVTPATEDTDITQVELTRNGVVVPGYELGTAIDVNASYVLKVTNEKGYISTVTFTVNIAHPPLVIEGVQDKIYLIPVTPTSSDPNLTGVTLTRDGVEVEGFSLGTTISDEGQYVLTATGIKGNTTVIRFSIISWYSPVTGIESGGVYESAVTPTRTNYNFDSVTLTRDSFPVEGYTLGTTIQENGQYLLTAVDIQGVRTYYPFSIRIDTTAPEIYGVSNGQMYKTAVRPYGNIDDIANVTLNKDGVPVNGYFLNTTISEDGNYELVASDRKGNVTRLTFMIASNDPTPVIQGVEEGHVYEKLVIPTALYTDLQSVELYKDGVLVPSYRLGNVLFENGEYVLTVTDSSSRVATVHFALAIPAKTVTITGIVNGQGYKDQVIPFSMDSTIANVSLTRNGEVLEGYTLGSKITEAGSYILTILDQNGVVNEFYFTLGVSGANILNGIQEMEHFHILEILYHKEPFTIVGMKDGQLIPVPIKDVLIANQILFTDPGFYSLVLIDSFGNRRHVHFTLTPDTGI